LQAQQNNLNVCKALDLCCELRDDLATSNCKLRPETIRLLWQTHRLRCQKPPVPWKKIARQLAPLENSRTLEMTYSLYRHALLELDKLEFGSPPAPIEEMGVSAKELGLLKSWRDIDFTPLV